MKRLFSTLVFMCVMLIALPAFAASSITITEHSIMFFVSSGKIGFQEALTYTNPDGEAIKISLPRGAEEVTVASAAGNVSLTKADLLETARGLETSIKVPKGNDLIELRYFVKPTDNGFDYLTRLNYESKKIKLLSTGDIVPFGHQLGQLPKEKAASGFYEVILNPIKVGELLQVRLTADPNALSGKIAATNKGVLPGQQGGTEASKPVRSSASSALVYILFFVLVILLALAVYYFTRTRRQS